MEVPAAAQGVARFAFSDLCDRPLGASDYLLIAREFQQPEQAQRPQRGHEAT